MLRIRHSQESDDTSDDALWLKYEREVANTILSPRDENSILSIAFGEPVKGRKNFRQLGEVDSKRIAAITISIGYRVDGFHSRASFCASATCVGVILGMSASKLSLAFWFPPAADRINHMHAST